MTRTVPDGYEVDITTCNRQLCALARREDRARLVREKVTSVFGRGPPSMMPARPPSTCPGGMIAGRWSLAGRPMPPGKRSGRHSTRQGTSGNASSCSTASCSRCPTRSRGRATIVARSRRDGLRLCRGP
jgi:hypothetical protein